MTERERLVLILNEDYGYVKRQKAEDLADKLLEHGLGFIYSSQGLEFVQNPDSTYSVKGIGKCKSSEIIIPSSYCGKLVTHIEKNAFLNCKTIKSVFIPKSIKNIGEWAFCYCSSLIDVTISDGVSDIRRGAFEHCTSLENIEIPDSVSHIDQLAFRDCSALSCIQMGHGVSYVGENAFKDCKSLKKVYYKGDISRWCGIEFDSYDSNPCCNKADLFIQGEKVINFIVPSAVTPIKAYTFQGCTSIKSVKIPSSLTAVSGFSGCVSLKSVEIPSSVTTVSGFLNCLSLESVKIPEGVEKIKGCSFMGCTSLSHLELPSTIKEIGMFSFHGCDSLKTIYYNGTIEEWKGVDTDRKYNDHDFTICCTDGNVNVKL